ncbi:MAG: hypothetical protein WCR04_03045 [Fibrobacteraceae bacterium]
MILLNFSLNDLQNLPTAGSAYFIAGGQPDAAIHYSGTATTRASDLLVRL